MNNTIKYIKVGCLFLVSIILGFVRERTFITINNRLKDIRKSSDYTEFETWLLFLKELDPQTLYMLKWILTPGFAIVFMLLTITVSKVYFESNKYNYLVSFVFLSIFVVAISGYGIGYLIGAENKAYTFSRFFMGLIQSPFILVFIIPAFSLLEKQKQ